jgi:tripartite-type tricarboxylate transporter receptor subunit TctC
MTATKSPVSAVIVFALAAVLPATAAAQQKFPSKPIRMLVPFSPGSQTDILARWIRTGTL